MSRSVILRAGCSGRLGQGRGGASGRIRYFPGKCLQPGRADTYPPGFSFPGHLPSGVCLSSPLRFDSQSMLSISRQKSKHPQHHHEPKRDFTSGLQRQVGTDPGGASGTIRYFPGNAFNVAAQTPTPWGFPSQVLFIFSHLERKEGHAPTIQRQRHDGVA